MRFSVTTHHHESIATNVNYRFPHLRDYQAQQLIVSELGDVLSGKSGVMAQWYQRHCVFMALEGVRQGVASIEMPTEQLASLATGAGNALLPAVEKESHEDTRAVGLGCLARWALTLDAIPTNLLKSLKDGLRSASRPTVTIFASAACQLSGRTPLCPQLAALVPDLLARVEVGAKKPNVYHPEAIYGAKAVLETAAGEASLVDTVDGAFPWRALNDQGSWFFPAGVIAPHFADVALVGEAAGPLAPHVCIALCQVIGLSAKRDMAAGDRRGLAAGVQLFSDASSIALVQCMLLPGREVRRVALEVALDVRNTVDGAQATLLKACQKVRALKSWTTVFLSHFGAWQNAGVSFTVWMTIKPATRRMYAF